MRSSLAMLLFGLVACGGGAAKGPESPGGGGGGSAEGGGSKPTAAGDVSFEVPNIEVKGVAFEPQALGTPGMPLAEPKGQAKPLTGAAMDKQIIKQREVVAKTKDPVQKQAQAALLATMLYHKSKETPADQQKLVTEARQTLRDSIGGGDYTKADEITLRMLGSYELILGDIPNAEKAWASLVANDPKSKDIQFNKAWLAYTYLQEFKNAEAVATLQGENPTEKTPELAYVTAWAKWRTGDGAGAWSSIVMALKGWGNGAGRDALDRDVMLLAGRTPVTMNAAVDALSPIYGKGVEPSYELYAKLGLQSYQFAGRWSDGVAALDKALTTIGAKVPPNDLPVIKYQQGDYTVRLDNPEQAAKYALEAIKALPACGTKCSNQDKENVVESVYIMGRLFHILYATAHDDRYYQPALDLYAASVPLITMNQATHDQAEKDMGFLQGSFKTMKHDAGTYDKDAIGALIKRHNQEVQACYEQFLAANPKLGGALTINLEANAQGQITGASSEPKAGMQDMAGVAGCVVERAKQWKLPKKINGNGTGTARMKLVYALSKRTDMK
ncbi:MAG: AgmX/PglI C-terminal domain-containing protein [Deltaproteobacteria bacterium]|nr:AgmX/PglI C-terminal domain-containing protein [Deltaproteobacteria bacterium]